MEAFQENLKGGNVKLGSFKKEFSKLKKLVGSKNKDFSSDKASVALLRAFMGMIVSIIPTLESKFNETGKGVYEISQMAQLALEVSNMLRAIGDKTELVDHLMEEVIERNLSLAAQHLNAEVILARREINTKFKNPKNIKRMNRLLDQVVKNHAEYLLAMRPSYEDRLRKILESE